MKSRTRYYQPFEKQSEKSGAASFAESWPRPGLAACGASLSAAHLDLRPPCHRQLGLLTLSLLMGELGHLQALRKCHPFASPQPHSFHCFKPAWLCNCWRPVCPPPALTHLSPGPSFPPMRPAGTEPLSTWLFG